MSPGLVLLHSAPSLPRMTAALPVMVRGRDSGVGWEGGVKVFLTAQCACEVVSVVSDSL